MNRHGGASVESRARARPRRPRAVAAAAGLTIGLAAAVAGVGGVGYAAAAPKAALDVVVRAFGPSKASLNGMPIATRSAARDQYGGKCNSGRGNGSEYPPETRNTTRSRTLVNPHEGERGPGPYPTDDCDPGNSGAKNRGGD